ncbi:MAG: hypothetical protein M1816_000632 [Peltula sp. TS41687]|nr:MAG: hypothetical protein M1816_000632 [Peltula sp. TS41687]
MATVQYQPPDLASVLKTLAQFAPSRPPAPASIEQSLPSSTAGDDLPEEGEYEPADAIIPPVAAETIRRPTTTASNHLASKRPAAVDACTIIDWPNGLRCVMKTVARNDAILARIRKAQIRTWFQIWWLTKINQSRWEGRQALLKKQEERKEGRKKLDDVLYALVYRSIRPHIALLADKHPGDTEDDANELLLYDRKVHRAAVEMVKAMSSELKDMGVPFFGTRSHLIEMGAATTATSSARNTSSGQGVDDGGTAPGKTTIDQRELGKLQRKMLEMLEDMCTG